MIKFYTNLLTEQDCQEIADEMMRYFTERRLSHENGRENLNSYGFFNLPSTILKTSKIEQVIKKDFGKNIVFENNYTRIYLNGATMECHVDRDLLDITLSVNIFSNLKFPYPLKISKRKLDNIEEGSHFHQSEERLNYFKEDFFSATCLPGEGAATLARLYPHWREPLVCAEDEFMIQSFFHWKFIKN